MRHGLPPGVTADTQLLLRFEHAQRSDDGTTFDDLSGNGNSATIVGAPTFGQGAYGAGVTLASASDYLTVADDATINIGSDITVECWIRRTDAGATTATFLDRTSTANAWRLQWSSADQLQFVIWDSGDVSATLTCPETLVRGRLYHVRCAVEFGGTNYMTIEVDGELWARRTTARADIEVASLGVLTIGQRGDGSREFVGTISDVRIQDAADTSADTASPTIQPERITHRLYTRADIDLGEELSGGSWTTSGSNYWIAWSAMTLGGFVLDWRDVVSVKATATAGGTETTFTEVGEEADLSSDDYWIDVANERVYSSEDPSGYVAFIVVVRYRGADKRMRVGSRSYRPTLITPSAGERSTPYIFQQFPTGGGMTFALSTQHADHPAAFGFEETGNVLWRHGAVTLRAQSDHMPASEAVTLSTGVLEGPPKVDPDMMRLRAYGEQSRLHRLSIEGSILTIDDYADAREDAIGYEFPAIWGLGHKEVPCPCIEKTADMSVNGINPFYKFKPVNHQVARISNVYNVTLGVYPALANIDLDNGTFQALVNSGDVVVCDIDGYGTPGTGASPADDTSVREFGDAADCISEPVDMLKEQLTVYAGVAAADMTDASWANTDGRAKIRRRFAEPLPVKGALIGELQRALPETLAFLFWKADGTLGLRDVRKADSVDATLYDFDVVSEEWRTDTTLLAKRAEASAYTYRGTTAGQITKGAAAILTLKADAKYDVREVFYPPPSSSGKDLTRIAHKGSLDTWLGIVRKFAEEPSIFYRAVVSAEFSSRELMDVIDIQVSSRPSAVGSRFRLMRIKPMANGTVEIECFAEDLFPADGTSAPAIRSAYGPTRRLAYRDSDGTAIPNAVGWNVIGDHLYLFQALARPSSITDRLTVYAQRTGGAADTDLQIRIYDLDASQVLATLDINTSAGFFATTTFANIPTTDSRLQLQAQTTNGASGELWSAVWGTEEVNAAVGDPVGPTTLWQTGSDSDFSCVQAGRVGMRPQTHLRSGDSSGLALADTSGAWTVVNDHQCIYDGALKAHASTCTHHFTVRAQRVGGSGDTDLQFRIYDITNSLAIGTITGGVGTSAEFAGGSFSPANVPAALARLELQYKTENSATGNFWAGEWSTDENRPASTAALTASTFFEWGSSAGKSTTQQTDTPPTSWLDAYYFPNVRIGAMAGYGASGAYDHMRRFSVFAPSGTEYVRATIYCDPGSSTVFHPYLMRRFFVYDFNHITYGPGAYQREDWFVLADFGIVSAAGFVSVDVQNVGLQDPFFEFDNLVLAYSKTDGNSVTVNALTLDILPRRAGLPFDYGTQSFNVPGARSVLMPESDVPVGTRLRFALYHDSSSETLFHPRIVNHLDQEIADFGAVSSDSGVMTVEAPSLVSLWRAARLTYTLDAGTTEVSALTLDAVYPELED